ncbi:MAG: gluconokinase [Actinomycetota bacterium]|nr:gluconokinase [Actinomycetota bacterium]
MGVSGSGKTTLAQELSRQLGWEHAEGDEFHPPANVTKMRYGTPLTDEDRRPWLRRIAEWISHHEKVGKNIIVTCSALRRVYRDLLRDGHPSVFFVHLDVARDVVEHRVAHRYGHYMPASLLDSQLATLEPLEPDEPGKTVPSNAITDDTVEAVINLLRSQVASHRIWQGAESECLQSQNSDQ